MKIGLLDCDPGRGFDAMFANWLEAEWTVYDLHHGHLPRDLNECDAYIATGSKASVYDDEPWIHQFVELTRRIHASQKPYIGVCFGHQMMGHALGGRVAKSPNGWGIGVHKFEIQHTEEWMDPRATEISLLMSCQDQVLELPPEAKVLAGSKHCPFGILRIGNMLGIQGHPEFPAAYAEALLRLRRDAIGAEKVDAALATLSHPVDSALLGEWAKAFLRQSH
jgi:GMP synthase-like glutamine amidotransferase